MFGVGSSVLNKMSHPKDEILKILDRLKDIRADEPVPIVNLIHWIKGDLVAVREMTQYLMEIANSLLENCDSTKRTRKNRGRKKKTEVNTIKEAATEEETAAEEAAATEEMKPPTPPPPSDSTEILME